MLMKIYVHTCLLLLFFISSIPLAAQQKQVPIHFANGDFITGTNISQRNFTKEKISTALFGDSYYVTIQFSTLPSRQLIAILKNAGVLLANYLPGNAYLAVVKNNFDFTSAKNFNISSVNAIPSIYKIDKKLTNYQATNSKENQPLIAVNFFAVIDNKIAVEALKNTGAEIAVTKYNGDNIIFIRANSAVINAVAALPFVSSIHLQTLTDKPLNYNSISTHGASGLHSVSGKNLNGRGVTIGIGDNSDISSHIDFAGRLINRSPWVPADHGTHVAGTAAGAGIINIKNQGFAPKARIVNQYFSDIISNAPAYITDYGMVLTNNSYYSSENGCPGEGEYDVLSNYADNQIANNNELLHVVASGNDGTQNCTPFPASFGTVKSGWQCAKNVLTVGALDTAYNNIAYFSSRGPSKDGRIKPEITSDGWAIISTISNNGYGKNWGTSMASPAVAGSLTLMYERYRQLHNGANPSGALMKALACNTADDMGNTGPDYTFGFGKLNALRAVEAIDSNRYFINSISNGGIGNHSITIPAGARRIKIMLHWIDPAAASNAATALVNDLDLRVITPSAALRQPLILNPAPANVNDAAIEGADHINNMEQVIIDNPAAGNYTINVNGFSVPFGPQEYVISYEIIQPTLSILYPFGGETWVPGENEIIRWNAFDISTNNFTLAYSVNNGAAWTTIDNNIPGTGRNYYNWKVPATVSNNALIRLSRNSTALSAQSTTVFTIVGQPVVTVANVCEGAVQLNWKTINSASSYDIFQLTGDSMKVVGNTTDTSFLITGLDKYTTYWLGVAAKIGSVPGRRSVSVSVLPNSGACTLLAFNNDLKVDSILEPNTARQQFTNAGNATKPVKILIKNQGQAIVSGPFNVSYSYNGNTVTETVNSSIAAGATIIYTFNGMYATPASGYRYDFKAYVTNVLDNNHNNDTAYKTVKYIHNDPITLLPIIENFESTPAAVFTKNEMAIGENKYLDFSASSARGRARTFVNSGLALQGNNALTLDQAPYNDNSNTDSIIVNYNLQSFAASQLRFDFYYKNHGQANAPGNKVWIRGSENDSWLQAYDLFLNQANLGDWKKAVININDVLASGSPVQTITKTFQVKIGQEGNTSANAANPQIDIDDGYTFDNLELNQALNDVAVSKINFPGKAGCGLTASTAIGISIKNYNNTTLINLPVSYQVNGGSIVTENIPSIAPNQSLDYVFVKTANLAAFIDYNIDVWIKYPADTYSPNDSILNYSFHNSPVISTYPYLQNFESSNGDFYTNGTNSTWQWGAPVATPGKTIINKTASGTQAWVTNLAGNYTDNETSYLISPCFDLAGLVKPVLSFSHIFDIEKDYDYTWLEYSTDGIIWQKLGTANSGTNWYDNATDDNWRLSNTKWHVASIDIPVTGTTIRIRFVMSSDGGVTMEGIGIDDVRIHEKTAIATATPPVQQVTKPVAGNNWVPFILGNNILAEIKPNGQDLGTVELNLYPNGTGNARHTNDQYYLDRNFVIKSTNNLVSTVDIRLYFTDLEALALMNANGCTSCSKPNDAYEIAITKYSGTATDENGSLDDNISSMYQFILPTNTKIVPHGNGYYAEFTVNSFSEFWFGKALIKPLLNSSCPGGITIFTTAGNAGNSYLWQEDSGTGYATITNSPVYSGTTNNTLQLISIPASYSGNKYRCLVNGLPGTENILHFTSIWSGATNTDWFTPTNWSCGAVPDQYVDVAIPAGLINYPVINNNTAVRSISVQAGATVSVNPGIQLDVKGQ